VLTKITIKRKTMMKCEVKSNCIESNTWNIEIHKKYGQAWGP